MNRRLGITVLTRDSLTAIVYLCLTKIGKPALTILRSITKSIVKNVMTKGTSTIRLGTQTPKQKNMGPQGLSMPEILGIFYIRPHIVFTVARVVKNYLFCLVRENLVLIISCHFTGVV